MIKVSNITVYPVGIIANPEIKNYDDMYIANIDLSQRKQLASEVAYNYDLGEIYQNSSSTSTSALNFQTVKGEQVFQIKAKTDED
ncbi:MAG: hypothetical protein LBM27_03515 [Lactobacillaceae bacterium]|jgi:hypothetical protein|nr:hypothetical protein [Lactobacillaceae bacterium]